jgi:hypothetical protein
MLLVYDKMSVCIYKLWIMNYIIHVCLLPIQVWNQTLVSRTQMFQQLYNKIIGVGGGELQIN